MPGESASLSVARANLETRIACKNLSEPQHEKCLEQSATPRGAFEVLPSLTKLTNRGTEACGISAAHSHFPLTCSTRNEFRWNGQLSCSGRIPIDHVCMFKYRPITHQTAPSTIVTEG